MTTTRRPRPTTRPQPATRPQTVQHRLSDLVFDYTLYPRSSVSSTHVGRLRHADQTGEVLPPYVIDRESRRVIDGFHRGRKDLLEHGPDVMVECIEVTYRNEGEMLLDAANRNKAHGLPLTPYDLSRCAARCREFGIAADRIAAAMGVTRATLQAICEGRTAHVAVPQPSGQTATTEVALKRSISHMAGQILTPEQAEANRSLSGMTADFHANQLILLIDTGLLDTTNSRMIERLRVLHHRLNTLFANCTAP